MEISVVIPAYNEAKVIAQTVARVQKYLASKFSTWEIIVVDDKSNDRTLEIIKNIAGIVVLQNQVNHGKGYTVKKGVLAAQGDWILFMDADSSTEISELDKLWAKREQAELVIGSRALADSQVKVSQNVFKVVLGRAGNWLSRVLIDPRIMDTQCGFKLIARRARDLYNKLTINDWGFDLELIFLARKKGVKVAEVPIIWVNNFDSKVKWWNYLVVLSELVKIRLNNLLGKYQ